MELKGKLFVSLLVSLSVGMSAMAQEPFTVTGKVTDASGQPVIGAGVMETGKSNGTITSSDGTYRIELTSSDGELNFSSLGYKDLTVDVGGRAVIDAVLQEDTNYLDEVVVVGYGVQRKSDLTGAISSINAEETMKKMPVSQVSDLLQGRVAGLSVVSSSGAAGASPTMRVRGINSIKADGGPLVVIDGFTGGSLDAVNPSDIQSIEILKDASSTAIYGSRGANGVILITTKAAGNEKVYFSYNGYVDFGTPAYMPEVMPVDEFARMANEWNQLMYGSGDMYTERQITNFKNGYDTFDYMDAIFKDFALSHVHDISLRGGSDKVKFLFSAQYAHNEGVVGISRNDAWNYRLKVDADILKNLRAGVNFYGSIIDATTNGFSGSTSILTLAREFPQTVLPYDDEGNLTRGTISNSSVYNPVGFIDEQKRNNNLDMNFRNYLQAYLEYEPVPGLTLRHDEQITFSNRYYGTTNSEQSYQGSLKGKSAATYNDTNGWGWKNTTTLNYTKEFNRNHRINATVGFESSISNSYAIALSAEGLTSYDIGWKNMMLSEDSKITSQSVNTTTAMSYFARVNYVLMDRYMVTATIRRDGSSLLAYDHRWDTFPAASVAWDLKKESFLRNADFLKQLKLRYGYGVSGNQAVTAYSAFSTYTAVIGADKSTAYTLNPGNSSLRWEKTAQHNIGMDVSFFNDRLTLSADYYIKNTRNAINEVILPDDLGMSSGLRNAAAIRNKGVEITLGAVPVNTKDFYWKADLTLAHNNAVITELGDIESDYMELGSGWGNAFFRYFEGQSIGTIYGLKSLGVWSTEAYNDPSVAKPTSPKVRPGSYRYEEVVEDGVINADDYQIIGNGQPKFNWGFNNTLNWRNFDLSVFFIGYHGFDIYNYPEARLTSQLAPTPALSDRWIAGVNEDARIAGFGPDRDAITSYENVASSTFVEKGGFVKLKNVTLGYTFKKVNLRLYFSAKNVFTITSYSGNDPELAISNPLRPGLDIGAYPSKREFIFGINLTL